MGERQRGKVFVLVRKGRKLRKNIHQLLFYKLQGLCHNDDIRVIPYIAGGGAQMDDPLCLRALHAVSVHMAHNIVTHLFFPCFGDIIIDILRMGLQFFDLFLRNGQAQFFFCFRQGYPQFSPCTEFHIRGKNILHFLTGISF